MPSTPITFRLERYNADYWTEFERIIIPELKKDSEDSKKFLMISPDTLS